MPQGKPALKHHFSRYPSLFVPNADSRRTAWLRLTGMVAPMVLDGPINGVWFQAYVDQVLVPTPSPGDIVIMDNLGEAEGARPLKERVRG